MCETYIQYTVPPYNVLLITQCTILIINNSLLDDYSFTGLRIAEKIYNKLIFLHTLSYTDVYITYI